MGDYPTVLHMVARWVCIVAASVIGGAVVAWAGQAKEWPVGMQMLPAALLGSVVGLAMARMGFLGSPGGPWLYPVALLLMLGLAAGIGAAAGYAFGPTVIATQEGGALYLLFAAMGAANSALAAIVSCLVWVVVQTLLLSAGVR